MLDEAVNLLAKKQPFFISMLGHLRLIKSEELPTMGTDGKNLYWNKKWVDSLTVEETAAALLHEVMHNAFTHLWRREKRNPMLWNIAADLSINPIVNESFKLPKGCLLDMKYYGLSAEEIYKHLPKNKNKQQGWGNHDKWEGQPKKNKAQASGVLDKIKEKLSGKKKSGEQKNPSSQTKAKWEKLFKNTLLKNYGKLPNSLKRVIEKYYYIPVIDWTALVSNLLSEDTTDYNFSCPDRRYLESDFILPDLYNPQSKLKDIVFAYDSSGSISQNQLFSFYMESLNLFNNFSSFTGWMAVCDCSLHEFKEIDQYQSEDKWRFYGGGGTDFSPVFKEIGKRELNPKAVFYFTDLDGEFPSKYPDYPVYWLVPSTVGDNYEREVPFGTVIKFMPKYT